ncbi:MAG TPA: POTRA domain-containing protein, partial [Thermoanaerobaculia bacterium]
MSRRGGAIRALATAGGLLGAAVLLPAQEGPPRIHEIRIVSENVFQDAETSLLARVADGLHGVTRDQVVRRELLFAEGDTLDARKLAETERNLRALGLFRHVEIRTTPVGNGEVDVLVQTRDSWTTEISGSLGRAGGQGHYGVSLEEKNLFGFGKKFSLAAAEKPDRSTREIAYADPQFLGRRVALELLYGNNSDGDRRHLSLEGGFRSLDSPMGAKLLFDDGSRQTRLYANGSEVARFGMDTRSWELSAGKRLTPEGSRPVARIFAGYRREETTFGPVRRGGDDFVLPDERRFGFFFARLELARPEFFVQHDVAYFLRDEDFDLGDAFSLEVGYSPSVLDAQEAVGASLQWATARKLPGGFVIGTLGARTRARGSSFENTLAEGDLYAVWRSSENSSNTLLARAALSVGNRLDREVQLQADGANGLRAYRLHAFAGDRRVILNFEDRVRLTPELLHLIVLGAAVFVDAGYAWPPGTPMRLSDLRADAGVGLRIGLPRASRHALFRFDIAYALRPDLQG